MVHTWIWGIPVRISRHATYCHDCGVWLPSVILNIISKEVTTASCLLPKSYLLTNRSRHLIRCYVTCVAKAAYIHDAASKISTDTTLWVVRLIPVFIWKDYFTVSCCMCSQLNNLQTNTAFVKVFLLWNVITTWCCPAIYILLSL
jgi:hypothetical protein